MVCLQFFTFPFLPHRELADVFERSMATFTDLVSSLDIDPVKRGKQFEVFVKWFLQTDPEWATQVEKVWLWEEYPDRWGVDCGIDLVFRHRNGEMWAAQAKCYSANHDITKHDVDKFLSESNRKGIDKRLLIATTDRIGANAKQVCDAQEKTVTRYLLSNFEGADVDYPASIAGLHTAKRKAKPLPREHQIEAITAVGENFQNTDRGQLIMACGTGKTFTTLWIKESLSSASTLVLLPSLGLLSQTLHEWTLAANQPFDVLCVCSDDTVGKRGGDEAVHSVADLAFPVTSNIVDITDFLKREGVRVIFSTYQSSPLVAEAQTDLSVHPFDLVIADEAHRCAGKVGSDFSTVLDSERIRANKRLFTTATPRTYSTTVKKAAGERGIEVVGMDDEAVFGKVLYALPFGEAIKRGLLTDYQVVIIGVDNPTIAQWIQNRELLKTDSGIENDAEALAAQIGLLKAFKDYDLQRVISFHSRVNRAESFTQDIQQVAQWIGGEHRPSGSLKSDFVSGAMPTDKRRRKLAQLKTLAPMERGLLANARCLSEGVDVPSLDGVAFIDPRSSQIDIIQAVGRAIRLSPNKKTGTIVLPVFIEDGDTPTESIEASNFKPIWDVLNALKAHDDVLSAEMDQLRTEMGRKAGSTVGAFSKIAIDLPSSVDQSFGESLRTYLVEQVTESWDFWFGLLQNYAEEHGSCLVPARSKLADGLQLGNWVANQRAFKAILSDGRKSKLESTVGWTWEPFADQWETGFDQLQKYVAANGTSRVPQSFQTNEGLYLGRWVAKQRRGRDTLSSDRTSRLQALPGWAWNAVDDLWEVGFKHLKSYEKEHGHCFVPAKYKSTDGYALGAWSTRQRSSGDSLSAERREMLDGLAGWVWDVIDNKWEMAFECLREYSTQQGNCLVPDGLVSPDGFKLGQWVSFQRMMKDDLLVHRREMLQTLPGWSWDPRNDDWEIGFLAMQTHDLFNGNCPVPEEQTLQNGKNFSGWISTQRSMRKQGKLSDERTSRLESIPSWTWSPFDSQWEVGFRNLSEYAELNKTCEVQRSATTDGGFKLGLWVANQRSRMERLTPEQKRRLQAITGWTWTVLDSRWDTGYRRLSEFAADHGGCRVPRKLVLSDGFRLGQWVSIQRTHKETLSQDRIQKLESLTGWVWDEREEQWDLGFTHLQEYFVKQKNWLVPATYKSPDGFQLGTWVSRQRTTKDVMSSARRKKLDSLDGWMWEPHEANWQYGLQRLRTFVDHFGHSLIRADYIATDGFKLGQWVTRQRATKNQMKMALNKVSQLEAVPGWVWKAR